MLRRVAREARIRGDRADAWLAQLDIPKLNRAERWINTVIFGDGGEGTDQTSAAWGPPEVQEVTVCHFLYTTQLDAEPEPPPSQPAQPE